MSSKHRIVILLLLLGTALWWWSRQDPPKVEHETSRPAREQVVAPAPDPPLVSPTPPTASIVTPGDEVNVSSDDRQRVLDAIDNLQFTLRDYATALGGNPVGTNAEITASLLGDNLKQLKLPPPAGSTRNDQGELCDPWGSPWFFHQLSGRQMEIRSAGPDRALYTADDFVR